jgi:phage terminase large subunit
LFDVQEAQIKTPGGGLIAFAGLQDHTAESIKSYEGFDVAWVEEAQTVSPKSLNLFGRQSASRLGIVVQLEPAPQDRSGGP